MPITNAETMKETIIHNATILPVNEHMDVLPGGSICVKGNTIEEISPVRIEREGAEYVDAEGMTVMPGFVNTHTHLPMTLLRGYADDLPLHEWLTEHIFPAEARWMTPENVSVATRFAFVEMIKAGTTCFNDMYFFEEVIAREAKRAGIRCVVGESLIDFPTPSFHSVDEGLARAESLLQNWKGDTLVTPAVCAHSPYTCSCDTLLRAKQLAETYACPFQIHLSETAKEVADLLVCAGKRPADYLYSIGLLDSRTVCAHGVWLDDREIARLALCGSSVAHCPKSNLKLASGIADVNTYLSKGLNVALGTDGAASNNALDMVEEMRFAALLAKVRSDDPAALNARQALRMATINGARALGLGDVTGSLEPGKRADLLLVHLDASNTLPVHDPYSAIVYAMNSKNIRSVMIDGRWVMRDRILLTIDKADTIAAFKNQVSEILRRG